MVTKTIFKQIRGFVIIWLIITALVCMMTFLAVYFTYNPDELNQDEGNPIQFASPSVESELEEVLLVLPSASPEPSFTPTSPPPRPTVPVFEEEVTEPPSTAVPSATPLPTAFPVDSMAYEVGI